MSNEIHKIISEFYGEDGDIIKSIKVDAKKRKLVTIDVGDNKAGKLIGKKGVTVNKLRKEIEEKVGRELRIEVESTVERKGRERDQFDPLKKYEGEMFDCVVLDGSNIITAHIPVTDDEKKVFSIERLTRTIQAVQNLGWPTLVTMQEGTYRYALRHASKDELSTDERELLKNLVESLEVSLIDNKEDDLWLWNTAIARNGWVLSHDSYKKEIEKYGNSGDNDIATHIKKRRVWLEFVGHEPAFTLPRRDSDTIIATKIQNQRDAVDGAVEKLTHVDARITIEGGGSTAVSFEIGTPIGRSDLKKFIEHEELAKVSGSHFIIKRSSNVLTITDLESTNGTAVNGMRIPADEAFPLEDGCSVLVGSRRISLEF